MTGLNIGKAIKGGKVTHLPLDFITWTAAGVGVRGSGKTNTFVVLAEEMLTRAMQVIVIDPLDVWWGLRSDASGKGPGFPITIMGGEHGDIPLEANSGAMVADFLVESRASAVLSVRHMSNAAQRNFVASFAERVYDLKGKSGNRSPVHIIIDEADMFAPQRLGPDSLKCFGAIDALVRRGRSSGIGVSLISQRTAKINKDVLSQVSVMFAMRLVGPQDRKALEGWVEVHDDGKSSAQVISTLHLLQLGESWVWSPEMDLLQRTQIRQRTTFDSSATPKYGAAVAAPKVIARVDLDKLKSQMAIAIQTAQANDPKALRAELAKLKEQCKNRIQQGPDPMKHVKLVEENKSLLNRVNTLEKHIDAMGRNIIALGNKLLGIVENKANTQNAQATTVVDVSKVMASTQAPKPSKPIAPAAPKPVLSHIDGEAALSRCDRALLIALATHGPSVKNRLCILAGYRYSGGTRNSIGKLRGLGYLDGSNAGIMTITDAGVSALGEFEPMPTGPALVSYWMNELSTCERAILNAFVEAHPNGLTKDELLASLEAAGTPYTFSGGTRNALGKLRTIGLITGSNISRMQASADLF